MCAGRACQPRGRAGAVLSAASVRSKLLRFLRYKEEKLVTALKTCLFVCSPNFETCKVLWSEITTTCFSVHMEFCN